MTFCTSFQITSARGIDPSTGSMGIGRSVHNCDARATFFNEDLSLRKQDQLPMSKDAAQTITKWTVARSKSSFLG